MREVLVQFQVVWCNMQSTLSVFYMKRKMKSLREKALEYSELSLKRPLTDEEYEIYRGLMEKMYGKNNIKRALGEDKSEKTMWQLRKYLEDVANDMDYIYRDCSKISEMIKTHNSYLKQITNQREEVDVSIIMRLESILLNKILQIVDGTKLCASLSLSDGEKTFAFADNHCGWGRDNVFSAKIKLNKAREERKEKDGKNNIKRALGEVNEN